MLDVNLSYRMPVCLTRKRASQESYETEAMHYDEDYPSICFRIRRFVETQAWAADPPTRVRRFVTSVRAWEGRGRGIFDVTDRKSVGWGKRVSVRLDLGGRRIIKKKNNQHVQ